MELFAGEAEVLEVGWAVDLRGVVSAWCFFCYLEPAINPETYMLDYQRLQIDRKVHKSQPRRHHVCFSSTPSRYRKEHPVASSLVALSICAAVYVSPVLGL